MTGARSAPGLGAPTFVAVLASNMVGTGVFTSLRFQGRDLHTPPPPSS